MEGVAKLGEQPTKCDAVFARFYVPLGAMRLETIKKEMQYAQTGRKGTRFPRTRSAARDRIRELVATGSKKHGKGDGS